MRDKNQLTRIMKIIKKLLINVNHKKVTISQTIKRFSPPPHTLISSLSSLLRKVDDLDRQKKIYEKYEKFCQICL